MNGFTLVAKLTDFWRERRGLAEKPVVAILDEGGKPVPLHLVEVRQVIANGSVSTALEFRRAPQ